MQLFGHNRHGPKIGGGLCPFWVGELGPHLIQCRLGQGLPFYTKWHLDPSSHLATTCGPKIGGCAPLGEGTWVTIERNVAMAEAYLHAKFYLDPSNRWPQYANVTCRTDNGPIA